MVAVVGRSDKEKPPAASDGDDASMEGLTSVVVVGIKSISPFALRKADNSPGEVEGAGAATPNNFLFRHLSSLA